MTKLVKMGEGTTIHPPLGAGIPALRYRACLNNTDNYSLAFCHNETLLEDDSDQSLLLIQKIVGIVVPLLFGLIVLVVTYVAPYNPICPSLFQVSLLHPLLHKPPEITKRELNMDHTLHLQSTVLIPSNTESGMIPRSRVFNWPNLTHQHVSSMIMRSWRQCLENRFQYFAKRVDDKETQLTKAIKEEDSKKQVTSERRTFKNNGSSRSAVSIGFLDFLYHRSEKVKVCLKPKQASNAISLHSGDYECSYTLVEETVAETANIFKGTINKLISEYTEMLLESSLIVQPTTEKHLSHYTGGVWYEPPSYGSGTLAKSDGPLTVAEVCRDGDTISQSPTLVLQWL
ncbi:hypothetical protein C0J52_12827 [Blattella germanica]|nr:hypothetical protein C0J52_12827 [Blattella germanica]